MLRVGDGPDMDPVREDETLAPAEAGDPGLLPDWYMPAPGGPRHVTGWRRTVIVVVILSFLLITAAGLCNTYGDLGLGS
jgi:hypothetical protein